MEFPLKAVLRDRGTDAKTAASLRPMVEADLEQWARWLYGEVDEDAAWEWDAILNGARRSGGRVECYVLYVGEELQGLLALDLRGRSTGEGRGLVVDYLATNPGNRRGSGGFKDVGKAFLGLAVHRSRELGWDGRLWLESLPDAESFYGHVGFSKLPGRSKEGNVRFALGADAADRIARDVRAGKTLDLPD